MIRIIAARTMQQTRVPETPVLTPKPWALMTTIRIILTRGPRLRIPMNWGGICITSARLSQPARWSRLAAPKSLGPNRRNSYHSFS